MDNGKPDVHIPQRSWLHLTSSNIRIWRKQKRKGELGKCQLCPLNKAQQDSLIVYFGGERGVFRPFLLVYSWLILVELRRTILCYEWKPGLTHLSIFSSPLS